MTMEVLSRHQFEVLGSAKVQEWTTSVATTNPAKRPVPPTSALQLPHEHHPIPSSTPTGDERTAHALSLRLQAELRAAKSQHLACAEVLLPADLLGHVAGEMVAASEKEPCGIRGCAVYVDFEDEPGSQRRIAALQVDASTVSTFELYLTLKHDRSGWTSMLPQFLKNFARSSTIMISPDYSLIKHKLYNSFSE